MAQIVEAYVSPAWSSARFTSVASAGRACEPNLRYGDDKENLRYLRNLREAKKDTQLFTEINTINVYPYTDDLFVDVNGRKCHTSTLTAILVTPSLTHPTTISTPFLK